MILCLARPVFSQFAVRSTEFSAEYTVALGDPASRRFHVTATFHNLHEPTLDVALPVWTPGVYTVKNYADNISKFSAHDSVGVRLRAPKVEASTWRIEARGEHTVIVEFDYAANDLSWNGAGITDRYALFTGTQLFLEPKGHRDNPATVRFKLPTGWRVASALTETSDSTLFRAANYDQLVDAPTVLGSFAVARFEVDGKPHLIVRAPADSMFADVADKIADLRKIITAERSIFGSLPYDKYVFFSVTGLNGGAIEHANSYLAGGGLGAVDAAHEFFHLWNVKRIRPAELWPYDYARIRTGPSLWVSEGVTSYYQFLVAYRCGIPGADVPSDGPVPTTQPISSAEGYLLAELGYRIGVFEGADARHYVSPSDASWSDGLGYGAASPNYYLSGELLGALLDLSILRDTGGKRRLDDVMRALYERYYKKGKGFTADDLVHTVSATSGRDYREFFSRYVTGTDDFPFDSVFAFAGYRISRSTRALGRLGGITNAHRTPNGYTIHIMGGPQSIAARAGLQVGDTILAVDGVPIHQVPLAGLYGQNWIGGPFVGHAGERVLLTVKRDSTRQIPVTLGSVTEHLVRIESDSAANEKALAIRAAWLKR
jgi:predicted metalloprotease with PDZ domain